MILSIGIDIAKEKIDIYYDGSYAQINNEASALKAHFKSVNRAYRIVMEATGKYHRTAHRVLESLGFTVMVINPYQSRHFAKAMNLLCKTDKVDAKLLSLFGETQLFHPTPCNNMLQENMQDLSRHLDDLKKVKKDLESRLREETNGFIKRSLKKTLKPIENEIKETENKLKLIIEQDEALKRKLELLISIPGVGVLTGISLLCYLKELGELNKCEIVALSGLAPVNNDSGTFSGKRRIRGGRHDVRSHLYMPVLGAATQHNKRLKSFYERLVSNGKPKKVALTACMRKLIIWANSVLATGEKWRLDYVDNH